MNEKIALFENMEPREIEALGASEREFRKGETIFREGDPARTFGLVLSGSIIMYSDDVNGNRNIILSAGPGFLFGEALAVLGRDTYPISAEAAEDGLALLFPSKCLRNCGSTAFLTNTMRVMARSNILFRKKINTLEKRTTREKLMQFLSDESKAQGSRTFEIPYDRQELADYLAVERSAMSAEIGRMVRDGLIQTRRSRFTLLGSPVDGDV